MSYSQFAATSQFVLYGKRHFTQTGYNRHVKGYSKEFELEKVDLAGKNMMVSGANSGVGKEIATFLARRGANVYMVCRSMDRAQKARAEIIEQSKNESVHIVQIDCSLEASVREGWQTFLDMQGDAPQLDGLVCCAGVLLNEKQLTTEGVEVTFACHLLFGAYLLGELALPLLAATKGRLLLVSSGGMYNTKFPEWEVATGFQGKYDGNLQYAYAKRGQVLLAEQWAEAHGDVKVVSCHPGWAGTDAVDAAYGDAKKHLQPLRTPWEGAEGMCWLLACPVAEIESGAFYLDRKPQVKHMAGPFFSEGTFTKNNAKEVASLMKNLREWASLETRPSMDQLTGLHEAKATIEEASATPAVPQQTAIDINGFMGKWYVVAHLPTFVDKGTANNTEEYEWDAEKKQVNVTFSYSKLDLSKTSKVKQTAQLLNDQATDWKLSVQLGFIPLTFPFSIHHCEEDYSACIVGEPKRSFLYIMARTPAIPSATFDNLRSIAMRNGYDLEKLKMVPQTW